MRRIDNLSYFFISLVLLLVVYPFLLEGFWSAILLTVLFSLILVTGLYTVRKSKKHLYVGILIAIPALLFTWVSFFAPVVIVRVISALLTLTFYVFVAVSILRYLFKYKHINSNQLFGAISVYILLGLIWSVLYSMIELISPGSFTITGEAGDFIYYSFVTLTTLGYGDILPLTSVAKAFASLEAVAGVLYLAVTIARFVALYSDEN